MRKCVARAVGVGSSVVPLSRRVIYRESTRWNLARRFGCLEAGRAGAAVLVSLSRALEFLFEAEERPGKGLDSRRASDQVKGAVLRSRFVLWKVLESLPLLLLKEHRF